MKALSTSEDGKLEGLQILRAFAAIIVVLLHITLDNSIHFHFNFLGGIFEPGWNGVDIFFVLSGFIITYIHFKDLGNAKKIYSYGTKRFLRIYPTYLIFVTLFFIVFLLYKGHENLDYPYIVKSFLLIPQSPQPLLGVSWTLCYEVVFYILFGCYILLGYRAFIAGITIHFFLIILNFLDPELLINIPILSFLGSNFNLEFLIGCLVGIVFLKSDFSFTRKFSPIFCFLFPGILLFLTSWFLSCYYPVTFEKDSFYSRLLYGSSSGLIVLGLSFYKIKSHSIFTNFFSRLGNASYILYLAHPLINATGFKVLTICVHKGILNPNPITLYCGSLLIFLACIIFSLGYYSRIEKRMLMYFRSQKPLSSPDFIKS